MSVEQTSELAPTHYIDTRSGRANMFSPPEHIADYRAWFIDRYNSSLGKGTQYSYGVAQRVQSIMNQQKISKIKIDVLTHGPHAGAAADALMEISNSVLHVDVMG